MRDILKPVALAFVLMLGAATAPATLAKARHKTNPARTSAIKQCREEYNVAVKAAKDKRGNERKQALAAARRERQTCLANAPK